MLSENVPRRPSLRRCILCRQGGDLRWSGRL